MANSGSLHPPKNYYKQLSSSFFTSPRLFTAFLSKGSNDPESILSSPTSVLDPKPFSLLKNPFWPDKNSPKPESKSPFEKLKPKGVGLGLVRALIESDSNFLKSDSKMVLFGSQLKVQIPPVVSDNESPKSPGDFGIKTRNLHVGSFSPRLSPTRSVKKSPFSSSNSGVFSNLSATEIELSEDYTCVITYGPNPRTTHIFEDCIVESCCGVVKYSEPRKHSGVFSNLPLNYNPCESFLSYCYSCKKNLGEGKDIYLYRGEKAFCSSDCRRKEMMLEDEEVM